MRSAIAIVALTVSISSAGCLSVPKDDEPPKTKLDDKHAFVADFAVIDHFDTATGTTIYRVGTLYDPSGYDLWYYRASGTRVAGATDEVPRLDYVYIVKNGEHDGGVLVQLGQTSYDFASTAPYGDQQHPGFVSGVKSDTGTVMFNWSSWADEKAVVVRLYDRKNVHVATSRATRAADGSFTYVPANSNGTATRSYPMADAPAPPSEGRVVPQEWGATAACSVGSNLRIACGSPGGGPGGATTAASAGIDVNTYVYSVLRGLQTQLANANGSMAEYRQLLMKDAWASMDSLKRAFGSTTINNWDDAQTAIHACEILLTLKNDPNAAPIRYYRDVFSVQPVTKPGQ